MRSSNAEQGFSLIEVMVAMFLLTVGLVSLSGLYGQAIGTMQLAQQRLIVKQKVREALESLYTARNTQQITFDMVRNVSDPAGTGIFLDGFQPVRDPNPPGGGGDGLVGTADDGDIEEIVLPGPDGVMGTTDDVVRSLANMQRQIQIQPIVQLDGTPNPNLRQITVTVRYTTVRGQQLTYSVGSYISRFR